MSLESASQHPLIGNFVASNKVAGNKEQEIWMLPEHIHCCDNFASGAFSREEMIAQQELNSLGDMS